MSKTFALEDDVAEAFDSPADTKPHLPIDSNLLSVNQLLESVCLPLSSYFCILQ